MRPASTNQPVAGPVSLKRLNLAGDGQGDLKNHGGEYQAVYCYPHEHYAYWATELARDDFAFGQFGENFTTQGLLENEVCIGDTFRIGEAIVQVTQPRVPCYKLADKLGIPGFDKTFLRANRSGFYAACDGRRRCRGRRSDCANQQRPDRHDRRRGQQRALPRKAASRRRARLAN